MICGINGICQTHNMSQRIVEEKVYEKVEQN
ncbi:MAG: hypothetical protein ABS871_01715 [Methanobrevibacter sp.]